MTISDPTVWGPMLVALTVYLSANEIIQQLRTNVSQANFRHHELMESIESIRSELNSVSLEIRSIETNNQPPFNEYDYQ